MPPYGGCKDGYFSCFHSSCQLGLNNLVDLAQKKVFTIRGHSQTTFTRELRRGVGGQKNRLFVNFYTIENVNGGGYSRVPNRRRV